MNDFSDNGRTQAEKFQKWNCQQTKMYSNPNCIINLLKPTGYLMHQQV